MGDLWRKGKMKVDSAVRFRDGPGTAKTAAKQSRVENPYAEPYPDDNPAHSATTNPWICTYPCYFCDSCAHLNQRWDGQQLVQRLCGHGRYAVYVATDHPNHSTVCAARFTPQSGSPPQQQGQYYPPPQPQYQQSPPPQPMPVQQSPPPLGPSSYPSYFPQQSASPQQSSNAPRSFAYTSQSYPPPLHQTYDDPTAYNQYGHSQGPPPIQPLSRAQTWDPAGGSCGRCGIPLASDGRCNKCD